MYNDEYGYVNNRQMTPYDGDRLLELSTSVHGIDGSPASGYVYYDGFGSGYGYGNTQPQNQVVTPQVSEMTSRRMAAGYSAEIALLGGMQNPNGIYEDYQRALNTTTPLISPNGGRRGTSFDDACRSSNNEMKMMYQQSIPVITPQNIWGRPDETFNVQVPDSFNVPQSNESWTDIVKKNIGDIK